MHRLDAQLKESHRRIREAVRASGTTLTELFGIGPIIACMLIGFTGDVRRFRNRDQFAAYNGTAPIETHVLPQQDRGVLALLKRPMPSDA